MEGYVESQEKARLTVGVHHLVARTYYGKKPFPEAVVNHIDGNGHNNHWKNLEWCTPAYNMQVARVKKGTEHHATKLTEEQVKFILESSQGGAYLAELLGVSRQRVNQIRKGKGWKHLNDGSKT
jgi:hypothetical protein